MRDLVYGYAGFKATYLETLTQSYSAKLVRGPQLLKANSCRTGQIQLAFTF